MNVRPKMRTHTYRGALTWTGAAKGGTTSYAAYSREYRVTFEGKPALDGSADPTFRGDPTLLNPEEMLVAALSSCHMLTYLAHCALSGIEVVAYCDDAVGTMEEAAGAGKFATVVLHPQVRIARGDITKARALHEDAHRDCFVAASVNFPVLYEATVEHAETAEPPEPAP
jgi:organic hydroperoxide reductase OsmC/OhrA